MEGLQRTLLRLQASHARVFLRVFRARSDEAVAGISAGMNENMHCSCLLCKDERMFRGWSEVERDSLASVTHDTRVGMACTPEFQLGLSCHLLGTCAL